MPLYVSRNLSQWIPLGNHEGGPCCYGFLNILKCFRDLAIGLFNCLEKKEKQGRGGNSLLSLIYLIFVSCSVTNLCRRSGLVDMYSDQPYVLNKYRLIQLTNGYISVSQKQR